MKNFLDKHGLRILDSIAEGLYIVDNEFKIQFVNKAALNITCKKEEEVIGKLCRSLCKSDRCEIGCPITEVLRTNENILDMETSLQKSDGQLIPIKLNASLLKDTNNKPIGGIITFKENKNIAIEEYLNQTDSFYGMIGKSKSMKSIFQLIKEIANTYATVLISGETGVGKELIANAIQRTSQREKGPFVKVNCASLPNSLLGSELFGHVKGAYTDAKSDRIGRFEYANGGTIFLDEITEIPIEMQAQLLRVLQEGTFERIGNSEQIKTDVRVIAATNVDIEKAIKEGKFRQDLYYRLNVIPIEVPSLKERKDDIIILVEYFLKKYCNKYNKDIKRVDDRSMELLMSYNWPGNVRELENTIEYAVIRSKRNEYLCYCSLPPHIRSVDNKKNMNIKEIELDEKTETLITLLRQNNWNKSKVAEILGIDRSTVHRQIKKLNDPLLYRCK